MYLKGQRWNGRVKIFNKHYQYWSEIDYKNGIRKEFIEYNKLIFEGQYLNGKRNGKGKEYYNNQLIYEGEYLNGERNGEGKEYKDYKEAIFFKKFLKVLKKWKKRNQWK